MSRPTDCDRSSDTSPVYSKLVSTFGSTDVESLLRVLFYLDQSEGPTEAWLTLGSLLNSDLAFRTQAQSFVDKTKSDNELNRAFRLTLSLVYEEMITEKSLSMEEDEEFELMGSAEFDLSRTTTCFPTLGQCWSQIPPAAQSQILILIPDLISSSQKPTAASGSSDSGRSSDFVKKVATGLEDIALSSDAIRNLQRWWAGEISGKSCASNIARTRGVRTGIHLAGALAGARIGNIGGGFSIGRLVGSVIGGLLSAAATEYFAAKMAENMAEIPKEEALENAYKFFGVPPTATNAEINSAFRKMCLKHHPDKGGKAEDFILVQVHMGVIKCARGELSSN